MPAMMRLDPRRSSSVWKLQKQYPKKATTITAATSSRRFLRNTFLLSFWDLWRSSAEDILSDSGVWFCHTSFMSIEAGSLVMTSSLMKSAHQNILYSVNFGGYVSGGNACDLSDGCGVQALEVEQNHLPVNGIEQLNHG